MDLCRSVGCLSPVSDEGSPGPERKHLDAFVAFFRDTICLLNLIKNVSL